MNTVSFQQTEEANFTQLPFDSSVSSVQKSVETNFVHRGLRSRRSNPLSDRSSFWNSVLYTRSLPTPLNDFPPTTGLLVGRVSSNGGLSPPTASTSNENFTPYPTTSPVASRGSINPIPAVVGVVLLVVCCAGCLIWSKRSKVAQGAQEENRNATTGNSGNTRPQHNSPELVGGMEADERRKYIESHLSSIIVQNRKSVSKSIRASKSNRGSSKRMSSLFARKKQSMALCAICLLEYEDGDKMCESNNPKCSHKFHKECMTSWLAKHEDCPCCRQKFLIVEDQSKDEEKEVSE